MKTKINARTIGLVLGAVFLTLFAVKNWGTPVYIWPLGHEKPILFVIVFCFLMGFAGGWLTKSLMAPKDRENAKSALPTDRVAH